MMHEAAGGGKDTRQSIGHPDGQPAIGLTLANKIIQQRGGVLLGLRQPGTQGLRELSHVAQAQVEPLAGDGMHGLSSIANRNNAGRYGMRPCMQTEGKYKTLTGQLKARSEERRVGKEWRSRGGR